MNNQTGCAPAIGFLVFLFLVAFVVGYGFRLGLGL